MIFSTVHSMFFWEHDVYQAVENWSTTPLYDAMRYREFNVDQKNDGLINFVWHTPVTAEK